MEKREKEYTNLDQERIVTVSDLLKEIASPDWTGDHSWYHCCSVMLWL